MLNLIINVALTISLGVLLFLAARALPRISDEEGKNEPHASRLMAYLERADALAKRISEKFLRRAKVVLMKLDNVVGAKLSKFKKDGDRNGVLKLDEEKEEKEKKEEQKET